MRHLVVTFHLMLAANFVWSQQWTGIDDGVSSQGIMVLYNDTTSYELLIGGRFQYADSSFVAMGLAKWNGTGYLSWGCGLDYDCVTPLLPSTFPDPARCFINYKGDIYVGGQFQMVNDQPIPHLAKWDGATWSSLGSGIDAVVTDMAVINDTLYVVGGFTNAGGITTGGIARWDGANWHDGHGFSQTWQQVNCISEYQGDIYVGGNFLVNGMNRLAKWDGNNWLPVGNGIGTSSAFVNEMLVYNDRLYVGGDFEPPVNPGTGLIAWDGAQWNDLNGGMAGSVNEEVTDLTVWNNAIVAVGKFSMAGGIPAEKVASWNDTTWCTTSTPLFSFDNTIYAVEVYHDSLFIGGNFTFIGTERIPKIAKLNSLNISDSCSIAIGIVELSNEAHVTIFPNPSSDMVHISSTEWLQNAEIRILDILGREVHSTTISGKDLTMDLSEMPKGIYLVRIETVDRTALTERLILE